MEIYPHWSNQSIDAEIQEDEWREYHKIQIIKIGLTLSWTNIQGREGISHQKEERIGINPQSLN